MFENHRRGSTVCSKETQQFHMIYHPFKVISYIHQINDVGALNQVQECTNLQQPRPIDLFISQKQTKKDRSEFKINITRKIKEVQRSILTFLITKPTLNMNMRDPTTF